MRGAGTSHLGGPLLPDASQLWEAPFLRLLWFIPSLIGVPFNGTFLIIAISEKIIRLFQLMVECVKRRFLQCLKQNAKLTDFIYFVLCG